MRILSREKFHPFHRLLCLLLIAVMLMMFPVPAQAAGSKDTPSRDIAIIFDNSSSMYNDPDTGEALSTWCKAIYAIEVFAAMMNEGDTVAVVPMNPITLGKSGSVTYTSDNPLILEKPSDASKVQSIYSPGRQPNTPIESIDYAKVYLEKSKADEQWLVLITDGAVFYENDSDLGSSTNFSLSTRFDSCIADGIRVAYLGIGVSTAPTVTGDASYYFSYTPSASNILGTLTDVCNAIFGRDVLESPYFKNNETLSFDVPISKLIVFAQGEGVDDVSLTGATKVSTYKSHYSEQGGGEWCKTFDVDDTLQGVIATFENLDTGEYTLDSGSADNVAVYYEPDVDLQVTLVSAERGTVKDDDPLYPGEYTIEYALIDKNGDPVDSPLLGDTGYTLTYKWNDDEKTASGKAPGSIPLTLSVGDSINCLTAEVSFLSGYNIEKTAEDLDWPADGFEVEATPTDELFLSVSGEDDEYGLAELNDGEVVYDLNLLYGGEPLTQEMLDNVEWNVQFDPAENAPDYEISADGTKLTLKCHNDDPQSTVCEKYTMTVDAAYTNDEGTRVPLTNLAETNFKLTEEGNRLNISMEPKHSTLRLSELKEAEPLVATLTFNRQALTEDQMNTVVVAPTGTDIRFKVGTPYIDNEGRTCVDIHVDPDQELTKGTVSVDFTATLTDEVGTQLEDDASVNLEFIRYPLWIRWLAALFILLLLVALVLLFMNMKILPNRMTIPGGKTKFTVSGGTVSGTGKITFSGKKKKNGSFRVATPSCPDDPLISGGFTLTLVALSPRRTKSKRRKAGVTKATPTGNAVKSFTIGSATFARGSDGKFAKVGAAAATNTKSKAKNADILCSFGNNAAFVISGVSPNGNSFSYSGNITFY